MNTTTFYAHSENAFNHKHPAREHLADAARLAQEFAGTAWWREEAALGGLLHDLGKYADLFQARLRGEEKGIDHWSPGAWAALAGYQAVGAALAIQGHHLGLQQGGIDALRAMNPVDLEGYHPLRLKVSCPDIETLKSRALADGLSFAKPRKSLIDPAKGFTNPLTVMLDVRMLFSCMVDADFLDTEAHFEGDGQGKRYRPEGASLDTPKARQALHGFMDESIRNNSRADRHVLAARNALWEMATAAAARPIGLFTLTAPTGSGKTLAMLQFALEHAARHDHLKRIILAVPFLSIIEQTAAVYRAVFQGFPDNFVLEHHSLAGLKAESTTDADADVERARRLLAENWDAPIILTTNVQLLESLFANRPSACRKLHNLMDSIIMFDEAQTLPPAMAVPTLATLSHLSQAYRSTVLFATATQPAFDALDGAVRKLGTSGWQPVEAAADHASLYDSLCRCEVDWPRPLALVSYLR